MRRRVDAARLRQFMERLARESQGPGRVYFTGGATLLLLGLRSQTIDIDIKLDPEPHGAFEAIARLKNDLQVNVELASPDNFIPVPSDWREQSRHIATIHRVEFCHFDFRCQALSKIERGYQQDLEDVAMFLRQGVLTRSDLESVFREIGPDLAKYPALDAGDFEEKLKAFLARP